MPLGSPALEALWSYIRLREKKQPTTDNLWVDKNGRQMGLNFNGQWLYRLLWRLGKRAEIPNLHTHRFRHTYATSALRGHMPERVLQIIGGWSRIPDTYMRTIGLEDAIREHRAISPADRIRRGKHSGRRML